MTLQNPYIWLREPLIVVRPEPSLIEEIVTIAVVVALVVVLAWALDAILERVVR